MRLRNQTANQNKGNRLEVTYQAFEDFC